MTETDTSVSAIDSDPTKDSSKLCNVCKENAWKYTCPQCLIHFCSVPCSRKHKTIDQCSGKRDRRAFAPTWDFGDERLLSDLRFLEDVERQVFQATREPLVHQVNRNLPRGLQRLCEEASKRKTTLKIVAAGMTKRTRNKTLLFYKTQTIYWTVAFMRPNESLDDERVVEKADERHTLADIYAQLAGDEVTTNKVFLLRVSDARANERRYHRCDAALTLQRVLYGMSVLEYPTFVVCDDTEAVPIDWKVDEPLPCVRDGADVDALLDALKKDRPTERRWAHDKRQRV